MNNVKKNFYQGFAVGIADLIRTFDRPTIAISIMQSNGITLKDLKDAETDDFDLRPIMKAWKSEKGNR